MNFSILASGSKGNCCVIQDEDCQIIIDCGSTKRYLTQCFDELNIDYQKSDALFITHNHKDHTSQIKMFSNLNIYAGYDIVDYENIIIDAFSQIQIKNLKITALPLSHDGIVTLAYLIENAKTKLVYLTDTGYVSKQVMDYIKNADYYIFESNHDPSMLMQTNRPMYVKQRIISDYGHLCNEDSAYVLANSIGDKTKEIVLAHISQEGNTPQLALNCLIEALDHYRINKPKIRVAGQFEILCGGEIKIGDKDDQASSCR